MAYKDVMMLTDEEVSVLELLHIMRLRCMGFQDFKTFVFLMSEL